MSDFVVWLRAARVVRCGVEQIRHAVVNDHYLHRWPDARSLPFAYCLEIEGRRAASDGRPWGFVVMKKPQHHRQSGLFGYDDLPTGWQVLDLARVWVHPTLQTGRIRSHDGRAHAPCVFSRMVSQVLRRLQSDWLVHHPPRFPELPYHIELVISYCELAHHDGTGYRAANFERHGLTADGKKEIYVRRLRAPRWTWQPVEASQLVLLEVA